MSTLYLILLNYVRPAEEVAAHVEEHRTYLRRHYAAGDFIVSGPRIPPDGGVILARAASEEEARALVADDPFNQRGIADYQFIAFDALWSAPAFAPLLESPGVAPAAGEG